MTFIFLGPSLNQKDARKILDAQYLPPAKLGDILTLVKEHEPKVIGLIDGYFSHTLSVWHKEILYAIEQKVTILGASSMGALRAAETDQFGMIGIGKIYEMYRDLELTDDDEVALVHGSDDNDYLNLSLPMVNIRITLQEAVSQKRLSHEMCKHWIDVAKSIFYPLRTLDAIAEALSREQRDLFKYLLTHHYIDQKKEDALLLLHTIAENKFLKPQISDPLHCTPLFQQLFHQDRSVSHKQHSITVQNLAKYVSVHHPLFSELRTQALNRVLVNVLAKLLRVEVSQEEIEIQKERFKLKHDLSIPPSFELWLKENHLVEEEFNQLMHERAKAYHLYTSPLAGGIAWRLQKALLEELKLNNQYSEWLEKAVLQNQIFTQSTPYYFDGPNEDIFKHDLFLEHLQNSEWDLDVSVAKWCQEAGFSSLQELSLELHKAKLAREFNGVGNEQHI